LKEVVFSVGPHDVGNEAMLKQDFASRHDVDSLILKWGDDEMTSGVSNANELVVLEMQTDLVRQDFISANHISPSLSFGDRTWRARNVRRNHQRKKKKRARVLRDSGRSHFPDAECT
jgi:hypothetical protein